MGQLVPIVENTTRSQFKLNLLEEAIATLGIPGSIAVVLIAIFALLQLIGEFIEAIGKVAPPFLKLRKIYSARKAQLQDQAQTLTAVKTLLEDVSSHYAADNITKRDSWMNWVNSRAEVYDNTIVEYRQLIENLTNALECNTAMTLHMFAESSRDRIIDFAAEIGKNYRPISREEFNRIFKVYDEYEAFLKEHNMTNGEVETNYEFIQDAYKERVENHSFAEDLRK